MFTPQWCKQATPLTKKGMWFVMNLELAPFLGPGRDRLNYSFISQAEIPAAPYGHQIESYRRYILKM